MKSTKLALLATAATLAFCASSAKAAIGVVTNYSKANFSFVITTNGPSTSKTVTGGYLYKYPTGTVKIGNKQLLSATALWSGTTWPAGAQLVIGWDQPWDGDILVVDKTGTNVLFDAYASAYPTAYFYVDFEYDYGAYTETYLDADPGYENWTETGDAYFYFYDDTYLPYMDLWAYGGETTTYKQSWDATGKDNGWSVSDSIKIPFTGDEIYLDNDYTTLSGKVTTAGKGKSYAYYWW